jgi:hypothetical protein
LAGKIYAGANPMTSYVEHFINVEEKSKTHYATCVVVNFYSSGDVTHDCATF